MTTESDPMWVLFDGVPMRVTVTTGDEAGGFFDDVAKRWVHWKLVDGVFSAFVGNFGGPLVELDPQETAAVRASLGR